MATNDWSDEKIRDRLQIQEVLYRYCRAIDRIDAPLLARQFHPDALIYKGETPMPVAEFVPDFAVRHAAVPRTSHMVTSFLIEFIDDDRAFVESWGLAVEQVPEGGGDVDHVYRVRYGDVFERRGGAWLISERSYVIDHVMSARADPALAPGAASQMAGIRSADDPLMRKRQALGLD